MFNWPFRSHKQEALTVVDNVEKRPEAKIILSSNHSLIGTLSLLVKSCTNAIMLLKPSFFNSSTFSKNIMPKGKPYPKRLKNKIIERIESGERLVDISSETGILPSTIAKWAMKSRASSPGPMMPALGGKTLEIFKKIVADGYFMGGVTQRSKYILQLHFPVRKVRVSNRCIYFLEGNEEIALKAFLENYRGKVINGQQIGQIARAFGIKKGDSRSIA